MYGLYKNYKGYFVQVRNVRNKNKLIVSNGELQVNFVIKSKF